MNTEKFNPSELSSRKLWQYVTEAASVDDGADNDSAALVKAVEELATRRHYMEQLLSSDRLAPLVERARQTRN